MYFSGKPLFPFGHGLTYARFEYSDLSVTQTDEGVTAQVTVTNTSSYDSDEVVQLYFRAFGSAVPRPLKKLCAFSRQHFKAGESRRVTLNAPEHIFRIYDKRSGKMLIEDCDCEFLAAASSEDIRCTAQLHMNGETVGMRADSFKAVSFDKLTNADIRYSKKCGESFLHCTGWSSEITFDGVPFRSRKTLTLWVSSLMGTKDLTVFCNDTELHIDSVPTDSFDDFRPLAVTLPNGLTDGTLTVRLQGDCCLLSADLA